MGTITESLSGPRGARKESPRGRGGAPPAPIRAKKVGKVEITPKDRRLLKFIGVTNRMYRDPVAKINYGLQKYSWPKLSNATKRLRYSIERRVLKGKKRATRRLSSKDYVQFSLKGYFGITEVYERILVELPRRMSRILRRELSGLVGADLTKTTPEHLSKLEDKLEQLKKGKWKRKSRLYSKNKEIIKDLQIIAKTLKHYFNPANTAHEGLYNKFDKEVQTMYHAARGKVVRRDFDAGYRGTYSGTVEQLNRDLLSKLSPGLQKYLFGGKPLASLKGKQMMKASGRFTAIYIQGPLKAIIPQGTKKVILIGRNLKGADGKPIIGSFDLTKAKDVVKEAKVVKVEDKGKPGSHEVTVEIKFEDGVDATKVNSVDLGAVFKKEIGIETYPVRIPLKAGGPSDRDKRIGLSETFGARRRGRTWEGKTSSQKGGKPEWIAKAEIGYEGFLGDDENGEKVKLEDTGEATQAFSGKLVLGGEFHPGPVTLTPIGSLVYKGGFGTGEADSVDEPNNADSVEGSIGLGLYYNASKFALRGMAAYQGKWTDTFAGNNFGENKFVLNAGVSIKAHDNFTIDVDYRGRLGEKRNGLESDTEGITHYQNNLALGVRVPLSSATIFAGADLKFDTNGIPSLSGVSDETRTDIAVGGHAGAIWSLTPNSQLHLLGNISSGAFDVESDRLTGGVEAGYRYLDNDGITRFSVSGRYERKEGEYGDSDKGLLKLRWNFAEFMGVYGAVGGQLVPSKVDQSGAKVLAGLTFSWPTPATPSISTKEDRANMIDRIYTNLGTDNISSASENLYTTRVINKGGSGMQSASANTVLRAVIAFKKGQFNSDNAYKNWEATISGVDLSALRTDIETHDKSGMVPNPKTDTENVSAGSLAPVKVMIAEKLDGRNRTFYVSETEKKGYLFIDDAVDIASNVTPRKTRVFQIIKARAKNGINVKGSFEGSNVAQKLIDAAYRIAPRDKGVRAALVAQQVNAAVMEVGRKALIGVVKVAATDKDAFEKAVKGLKAFTPEAVKLIQLHAGNIDAKRKDTAAIEIREPHVKFKPVLNASSAATAALKTAGAGAATIDPGAAITPGAPPDVAAFTAKLKGSLAKKVKAALDAEGLTAIKEPITIEVKIDAAGENAEINSTTLTPKFIAEANKVKTNSHLKFQSRLKGLKIKLNPKAPSTAKRTIDIKLD